MKKPKSIWVSASLSFAVADSTSYINKRGCFGNDMMLKNFKTDTAPVKEKNSVQIFNLAGKLIFDQKSENEINKIAIEKIESDLYFVVVSDNKTYWIAKQFVKF